MVRNGSSSRRQDAFLLADRILWFEKRQGRFSRFGLKAAGAIVTATSKYAFTRQAPPYGSRYGRLSGILRSDLELYCSKVGSNVSVQEGYTARLLTPAQ